jgi:hypothetical protein
MGPRQLPTSTSDQAERTPATGFGKLMLPSCMPHKGHAEAGVQLFRGEEAFEQ